MSLLSPGADPATVPTPNLLNSNQSAGNAAAGHIISDGHGDIVIVAGPNVTNTFPDNQAWSEPGRLMSASRQQFLNGGTTPAVSCPTVNWGDVPIPQEWPLSGDLHELLPCSQRLDAWFCQRRRW